MNHFENAIAKNELLSFAIGENDYYVLDREYGEHSVIQSWQHNILLLISLRGNNYVQDNIRKMLKEILKTEKLPLYKKAETLLYHLHVYYYLGVSLLIKVEDLSDLNAEFLTLFNTYIKELKNSDSNKAIAIEKAIQLIQDRGGLVAN